MKHLITSLTSAALLLALAGCMDVGTPSSGANSAASASASAQVKALCDSSVAKSKAGDVAGAQADINQAIANVARVKLEGDFGAESILKNAQMYPDNLNMEVQQKKGQAVAAAIDKIEIGQINTAKNLLDSVSINDANLNCVRTLLEAYTVIGDFTKARVWLIKAENMNGWYLAFDEAARYRALIGDSADAKNDYEKALVSLRGSSETGADLVEDYVDVVRTIALVGNFDLAYANLGVAQNMVDMLYLNKNLGETAAFIKKFQSNPTLCWSNPANPRRVAMAQVSKARCELALAQAKAGDIGAAKATLYFIIDEPDKIATEQAIAQAGAAFLQSGNVAKGIETLVVIPPAKQATAAQIRETIKTWLDIKNAKLAEMLAKLSPEEKGAFKTKLELAILDCATQANAAKNMSIAAAENRQGDPIALSELSDNYLNLQNVLKAVYKSLSEE